MDQVTAFLGDRIVARGERGAVTRELERLLSRRSGRRPGVRGRQRPGRRPRFWDAAAAAPPPPRRRGRPSLGVAAREVTLLPRHWEWLSGQPGGASAAIRRLVEEARRKGARRRARNATRAYRFMSDMCGDRPGYEEALRALYRGEEERLRSLIADWPKQVRGYVEELLA